MACAAALPSAAFAETAETGGGAAEASDPGQTGGTMFTPPPPPPKRAKIDANGYAIAPAGAPTAVKRMIQAANMIVGKPYRYGGGHKPYARTSSRSGRSQVVLDSGYDCSGSISFALYGARLLRSPLDSRSFARWGLSGPGRWVTVYTNPGHAYIVIAGLRFDTSMRDDPSRTGPAWSKRLRVSDSYVARHPKGL